LGLIRNGLTDVSFSRDAKHLPWGIPVPKDKTQVMYVWCDALTNYLSGVGYLDNKKRFKKYWPTDLHIIGKDILRFHSIFWPAILLSAGFSLPKKIFVHGFITLEGRKMSKSLGNYVTAEEAIKKSSVDALRFWAASGGSTGNDIPFSWKNVEHAQKFITKLWNIFRFAEMHFGDNELTDYDYTGIDNWIIFKLHKTVNAVTTYMDNYQFSKALVEIENFVWHELADNYLEMIKFRLYDEKNETRNAALHTLYKCLFVSLKMLAPFMPFITEEIYQKFMKKYEGQISVHVLSWPEMICGTEETNLNMQVEKAGELAKQIISTLRQYKSSRQMPLNAEIEKIIIDCNDEDKKYIEMVGEDLRGVMKIKEIIFGKADEIEADGIKIDVEV